MKKYQKLAELLKDEMKCAKKLTKKVGDYEIRIEQNYNLGMVVRLMPKESWVHSLEIPILDWENVKIAVDELLNKEDE